MSEAQSADGCVSDEKLPWLCDLAPLHADAGRLRCGLQSLRKQRRFGRLLLQPRATPVGTHGHSPGPSSSNCDSPANARQCENPGCIEGVCPTGASLSADEATGVVLGQCRGVHRGESVPDRLPARTRCARLNPNTNVVEKCSVGGYTRATMVRSEDTGCRPCVHTLLLRRARYSWRAGRSRPAPLRRLYGGGWRGDNLLTAA